MLADVSLDGGSVIVMHLLFALTGRMFDLCTSKQCHGLVMFAIGLMDSIYNQVFSLHPWNNLSVCTECNAPDVVIGQNCRTVMILLFCHHSFNIGYLYEPSRVWNHDVVIYLFAPHFP